MKSSRRIAAVDILRGLAILGMHFSGRVAYQGLPAWMYHAQEPPPTRAFNDQVFGITWVDLIFPFFLFSMGVAIPLAQARRLNQPNGAKGFAAGVWLRGLMLATFSLLGEHFRPNDIDPNYGNVALFVGLLGFFILGMIFIRLPENWPEARKRWVHFGGWALTILIISRIPYPVGSNPTTYGIGFSNDRNDIILMVLANVSVSASFLWYWTRNRLGLRLGAIALLALIFTGHESGNGIAQWIWNADPMNFFRIHHWPYRFDYDHWKYSRFVPIVYHFNYHKYLLITLPGTICGDLILSAQEKWDDRQPIAWSRARLWQFTLFGFIGCAVATIGLLARWVVPTGVFLALMGAWAYWNAQSATEPVEKLIRIFVNWGTVILLFGMLVEPLGGGIRKDEATLSYFFVTSGLAFWVLASLVASVDGLGQGRRWKLVEETGQNPILGYIVITNVEPAVFGLTYVGAMIESAPINPWFITLYGFTKMFFVMYFTAICTRLKIFFRA